MQMYQDSFTAQQMNGELLSECDEEVLKTDLGIGSKLHRMRLLKIISGRPIHCIWYDFIMAY